MTRDYDDPDDLPGLADVDDRDRFGLPASRVVPAAELRRRLFAGEPIILAGITPSDLADPDRTFVELDPFAHYRTGDTPTMDSDTATGIDHDRPPSTITELLAPDPEPSGSIEPITSALAHELSRLDHQLDRLERRLDDVLGPEGPTADDVPEPAGPPSRLARELDHHRRHAARLADRVADLIDRVDI